MLDILSFMVLWLSRWYDSCPCHFDKLNAWDMNNWAKRARIREIFGGECVMNGRRAPEFSSGAMMGFVRELLSICTNVLLAELAQLGLQQDSIGIILQDFANARRLFWFTMVVKHSYWSHPPWCFFAIGHRATHIARACARRCLRLRQDLLREPFRPIHYITKFMLFSDRMVTQL